MTVPAGGALPPDLMLAHAGSIRALALSILGDEHAAEDVLQETWVRALRKPPPRHDSIGGWLRRVAEGIAISRLRSEGRRRTRETHWVEDRDCAHTSYDASERAEVLRAVVDEVVALDEPYREAILRRYFEGLPPREIARVTQTSVATVNSRLQRAQAKLEERLQRRLSDRCGGMRGALLALVGWPEEAAAAAGAGWLTKALATKVALGAAGAAAVVALALWLGRDERGDDARPEPSLAEVEVRRDPALLDVETARAERIEAAPAVVVPGPAEPGRPVADPVPAPYAFELAIEPLDARGRALAACPIWLGSVPGPLALVGETAWDGALRLAWRGDEPEVELVVRAGRPGFGSTTLRRVRVRAGGERVVRLGLDGARASESGPSVLGDLPIVGGLGTGRPQRDGGRLLRDRAGNACFEDPWLLLGPVPAEAAAGVLALAPIEPRVSGAPLDAGAPRAWIEVRALDADGRPIPDALVSFSAAGGGFREDIATGPSGIAHAAGVPPGSVLVAVSAPAGAGLVATRRMEVAAGARLVVDLPLPREPLARVQLVDADGSARAGWLVELRDASGSTLARAQLDEQGRATLPIPGGGPALLLARADPTGAGVVVSDALLAHDFEQVLPATFAPHVRSLRVVVRGDGAESAVVRVARVDSGEALDAAPTDDPEVAVPGARVCRARGLSRGLHRVLIGAPRRGWVDAGLIEISGGRGPEIVEVTLPEPARVTTANGPATRLRLVGQRAGLRVLSPDVAGPEGRMLAAAPGAWDLVVERVDRAPTIRRLDLASGSAARIE